MFVQNPFRPGAGHPPPYLAGRDRERREFERLLGQAPVLENLVLTGLRGVGKTVLLDTFKPLANRAGWAWAGTDLSESSSVTEPSIATRVLTDLASVAAPILVERRHEKELGFHGARWTEDRYLDFETLHALFDCAPGLVSDKLKFVLGSVWPLLAEHGYRGLVFAYDEAQTVADHPEKDQYPLALLLDVFQSIQKTGLPYMLVMTGLPTLFPKLVESRTFAERMFRVLFLDRLEEPESREAILKPLEERSSEITFDEDTVAAIVRVSGGYPYFLQFVSRELFDAYSNSPTSACKPGPFLDTTIRKLDSDFFAGRWARATDRQRELLEVIAQLENANDEFSLQELIEAAKRRLERPFSASHANQMLAALITSGLVYKNRHGRYSLAVPLLDQFIQRQLAQRTARRGRSG